MIIENRYYQQNAIDKGVDCLKHNKPPGLLVLPTAAGKSLVVGNIANSVKGSTLVLQPSKEILEQNYNKMLMLNPNIDAAMYSASVGKKDIGKVTFSTIGSIYKKPDLFSHFDNVIIDEAHCVNPEKGMYKSFFNAIGNKPKIGLTATPYRTYRNRFGSQMRVLCRTRDRVFSNIIHVTQIDEMLGNNPTGRHYLAPLKYYDLSKDINFDSNFLRSNSTGAEFTQESIDYHMEQIGFYNSILGIVERVIKAGAGRKKILIFTESIAKSQEICKSLGLMGYTAATVSAYTPKKERAELLRKFAEGAIHIMVNVQALTTGVDIPGIDCIIDGNPTKSLQLYLQKIGRGARIDPLGIKIDCWVIDLVENFMRFGKMNEVYIEHSGSKKANAWNIIHRQKNKRDIIINELYM